MLEKQKNVTRQTGRRVTYNIVSTLIVLMELDNRLYTLAENIESEILVWRMNSIALKAKAHKHSLYSKNLLKITDDRYTATATHRQRFLTECLFSITSKKSIIRSVSSIFLAIFMDGKLFFVVPSMFLAVFMDGNLFYVLPSMFLAVFMDGSS